MALGVSGVTDPLLCLARGFLPCKDVRTLCLMLRCCLKWYGDLFGLRDESRGVEWRRSGYGELLDAPQEREEEEEEEEEDEDDEEEEEEAAVEEVDEEDEAVTEPADECLMTPYNVPRGTP